MAVNEKDFVKVEDDKYYISADSTYADDRVQVLNHCDTFGIFDSWGDILPIGKQIHGLYHQDTRYISRIQLKINNYRPTLLSSTIKEENEMLSVDLTNPEMKLDNGQIVHHGSIHIRRMHFMRTNMFHEKTQFTNFNDSALTIILSLRFEGDFKDIFEVRGLKRARRGNVLNNEFSDQRNLTLGYEGLDQVKRTAQIQFSQPFFDKSEDTGTMYFELFLQPNETSELDYHIVFKIGENSDTLDDHERKDGLELEQAKAYFASIHTSNEQFTHWINRSLTDLVSLMSTTVYGKYPYAGVPWYNTAFGRDGILTAFETLWLAPELSKDVLRFLAKNQASELNEASDAEPGKILHETRGGEMVALNEVPFKKYYGTIDATPLFVMLAGEYYDRTADLDFIKEIWPNLEAAIGWIDNYGDLDNDGFVEYKHKAANGLANQGWKDSLDSVSHEDGQLADPPIALCEVQGYVYAAKMHAAKLARILGRNDEAEEWEKQAGYLKEKFNKTFWDNELQCYVLALDGNKQPCRVVSSNAGHVLFTGIADHDKAEKVAKAMMAEDMFSEWGIRTLSTTAKRYNPMSYHNGSVWPHDVALISYGLALYGMQNESAKILQGLFDASLFIDLQRLPELFCGFPKRNGEGPTAYPVACSPQAWSVAAVFMLLQAILQIRILPEKKEVVFLRPVLPEFLPGITISNLPVGDTRATVELIRYEEDQLVGVNWLNQPRDWRLVVIK
ncbi:Glycogen debranching enzyme [Fulvivirga imtechensis AK7]|uniref:Glycogen debranching enzyme n=1 Tax=Fulvivirga imtechensis AK7 TaxID=1237149 RepID=L8JH32_9BACT|nr:amylo-alpha-1,6-glucosidase [Fulvivirga imtechensis]ELR68171.1 Glycogen debranching enzyme [Fulvivirga imtechensis AK7]